MSTARTFEAQSVRAQIIAILRAWGLPADAATTSAEVMVDTDLSAIDSHGISMLVVYEKLLSGGLLNPLARPEMVIDGPAFAVVDGHRGLGHPTAVLAMNVAIEKALRCGIGAVAVRNSLHFGAVGYYARLASHKGLFGLVTTTTRTAVTAATGGTTPILGTNPLAFSAPRTSDGPLVVDISTSVVALNQVRKRAGEGLALPDGWVFDREGNSVTDATSAYSLLTSRNATLSPLGGRTVDTGGHKGYGLSLMVEVLSAALSSAMGPLQSGDRDNLGHFFLAINPEAFNPGGATPRNVEEILRAMQVGESDVRIPGDPEREARATRTSEGIPIPPSLVSQISEIAARAGAPMLLT
jgi:LDH2 family malate/lactate/ureidoglycolate dehydrogenase